MITDYKDLTIKDFQRLTEISNKEYEFDIDRELEVLSVLTGEPVEDLETLPRHEITELSRQTDFLKKSLPEKLRGHFRIGFKRYQIELKAQNITAEQFILLNKYTASESSTIENLHFILAVLSYELNWFTKQPFSHDFERKAKDIQEHLTIDIAYPVAVFFCKVYQEWLQLIQTYLTGELKKTKEAMKKHLPDIGDGTPQ